MFRKCLMMCLAMHVFKNSGHGLLGSFTYFMNSGKSPVFIPSNTASSPFVLFYLKAPLGVLESASFLGLHISLPAPTLSLDWL